jgi:hypothetical protein
MGLFDAVRFTGLYLKYGAGYRWSFPCNDSGKTPDSFIGKVSRRAMDELNVSESCIEKEMGYWIGAMPGALIGEALYFMLGD